MKKSTLKEENNVLQCRLWYQLPNYTFRLPLQDKCSLWFITPRLIKVMCSFSLNGFSRVRRKKIDRMFCYFSQWLITVFELHVCVLSFLHNFLVRHICP